MITMLYFDDWISRDGIYGYCVELVYKLCLLTRGLGLVYKQNSFEFSIDLRVLGKFYYCLSIRLGSRFSNGLSYHDAL